MSSPGVANWRSLVNRAQETTSCGNQESARQLLEQAVTAVENAHESEAEDVALSFVCLADFLVDLGDYLQAGSLYRRAIVLYESAFGPASMPLALAMRSLADVCQREGHLDEAAKLKVRSEGILFATCTKQLHRN